MEKELLNKIIEWDIENWSLALKYWENNLNLENRNFQCLELGGRNGGLSLWLALKGNEVTCTDLESPEKAVVEINKNHNTGIRYQAIDATNIPYENYFDIVIFKSILGGIARNNANVLKEKTINEIYKALKKDGVLLFAENTESSFVHKFLRKNFIKWGSEWNYLKVDEIKTLFSSFKSVQYITIGFLAAFGRNEAQRKFLGKLDRVFEKLVPKRKRYILIGIAKK